MAAASAGTLTAAPTAAPCCPQCGFGLSLPPFDATQAALLEAQREIADLNAQVRLLNQKASAAVDRWADYEDEIAKLRAQLRPQTPTPTPQQLAQQQPHHHSALPTPPSSAAGLPPIPPAIPSQAPGPPTSSAASRISALFSSRKSPPPPPIINLKPLPSALPPPNPTPPPSTNLPTTDLLTALARERFLRQEAEARLRETGREVEELSTSLFEQANEMVATERRARAQLEARIAVLDRRGGEGARRLEGLERAVGRIERVRGVL
ncbi:hypothetical protein BT67DRAFT_369965, partial [Trichocladium antarcticum]